MQYPIVSEITPTFNRFIELIDGFSPEQFNKIPFEGSWTAGQVAQHMALSASSLTELLNGRVSKPDRDPEMKIPMVREVFLNFETKMQSPEFIVPEARNYDVQQIAKQHKSIEDAILQAAATLDLSLLCEDFELPVFGKLTRVEWIAFVIYHMQRHTVQLEKIASAVT